MVLSVEDDGDGMDEAAQASLFEPFFTTKAPGKGSGLGLAMVRDIVRTHGGEISVSSRRGEGTVFRCWLPLGADQPPASPPPSDARTSRAPGEVLLVEDERLLGESSGAFLRANGFTVHEASTAREAEFAFESRFPSVSLVVCDVGLPDDDGLALVKRLRTRRPDLAVVLVSGAKPHDWRPEGLDTLHSRFLPKPFDGPALLAAIRSTLDSAPGTP